MNKNLKKFFINEDIKMTTTDWCVDIVIALGIFAVSLLQLTASASFMIPDPFTRKILGINSITPTMLGLFYVGLTAAPVIFRRKYSWAAFIVCLVVYFILDYRIGDAALSMMPLLLVLGTLAGIRPMGEAIIAGFISMCIAVGMPQVTHQNMMTTLQLVQNIALVFAATGTGIAFKSSRDLVKAANLRTEQVAASAKAETLRRLEEERVAIARELHDITAHSLSAISIQAAAAEAQLINDTEAAKESIKTIRKTSKSSLNEIRKMIGILRDTADDEEAIELAPTIGTESLNEIKTYLEAGGVNCTIDRGDYDREAVPGYVDFTLFGITREAATNIIKHAHASNVEISLKFGDCKQSGFVFEKAEDSTRFAQLKVQDDGVGVGDNAEKTEGHGVEGMRERVKILGGDFSILNALEGGTVILIKIPIPDNEE
jgi:signal transduction histidine kinase